MLDNPLVQLVLMLVTFGICVVMAPRIKRRYGMPAGAVAPSHHAPTLPPVAPVLPQTAAVLLQQVPLDTRKNTILAGAPGDGKTQSSIALMVADIANGAQVYWLNPHYALFHPKDQTTDLRPLTAHFTHLADYDAIVRVLAAADTLIDQRMPLYRAGHDVGHHVVLYIDEAPAIFDVCGERFTKPLRSILREGRKCQVWIVLASQDAQVETLGLKSGLRNNFHTRLAGNVEQATWQALIGTGVPKPKERLTRGCWHCQGEINGVVQIIRPAAADIAQVAAQPILPHPSLVNETPDAQRLVESAVHRPADELDAMRQWLQATPEPSGRAAARWLYRHRGNVDEYDGSGPMYYEATALLKQARSVD